MSSTISSSSGSLRITELVFKAGASPRSHVSLDGRLGPVLVLVGPNNSGKSLALREIENWCFGIDEARKVIEKVIIDFPKDVTTGKKTDGTFQDQPRSKRRYASGGLQDSS